MDASLHHLTCDKIDPRMMMLIRIVNLVSLVAHLLQRGKENNNKRGANGKRIDQMIRTISTISGGDDDDADVD